MANEMNIVVEIKGGICVAVWVDNSEPAGVAINVEVVDRDAVCEKQEGINNVFDAKKADKFVDVL